MEAEGVKITDMKRLRACIRCRLIKSENMWVESKRCDNCNKERDNIFEHTTPHFEGLLAITRPAESWLSRYQGFSNRIPGVYCLKIHGETQENDNSYESEDST